MDFWDLLMVFFAVQDYTEGVGVSSDTAAFIALLVFAGGIVFWLFAAFVVVLGVCRGVRHCYIIVRDMTVGWSGSKPAE